MVVVHAKTSNVLIIVVLVDVGHREPVFNRPVGPEPDLRVEVCCGTTSDASVADKGMSLIRIKYNRELDEWFLLRFFTKSLLILSETKGDFLTFPRL